MDSRRVASPMLAARFVLGMKGATRVLAGYRVVIHDVNKVVDLQIVGTVHWANGLFEACGSYQRAREVLKNSLESNATRVEFGVEGQAVGTFGVYRRTVMDDGILADQAGTPRHMASAFWVNRRVTNSRDPSSTSARRMRTSDLRVMSRITTCE